MGLPKAADNAGGGGEEAVDQLSRDYLKGTTEMMQQMALSMTMSNALQGVRSFDCANMALQDVIIDIRHGATNVAENPTATRQYINAVVAKLKRPAKECIWGKNIITLDDLIKPLKKRFTPGYDYANYADKINSLPNETL